MKPQKPRLRWFGSPGHFCEADRCHFHLHTHVGGKGGVCVSTVGDYAPSDGKLRAAPLAADGRTYETMVFRLRRGIPGSHEMKVAGANDATEADRNHAAIVEKWQRKLAREVSRAPRSLRGSAPR